MPSSPGGQPGAESKKCDEAGFILDVPEWTVETCGGVFEWRSGPRDDDELPAAKIQTSS